MQTQLPDKVWTRQEVLEMHDEYLHRGATLRALGERNGISHERVRQLFDQYNLETKRIGPRKSLSKRERRNIWAIYRRLGTIDATAEEVKHSRAIVAAVVEEMPLRQVYRRLGATVSYERSEIIDALREAAKVCGEPLTIPAYRKQAPVAKWPTDVTVVKAFGSWADACEAAGVKANRRVTNGQRRSGAFSEQDCVDALRAYTEAHEGDTPSYERYTKWARGTDHPSGPSVRAICGSWREALRKAFG
jgi:hypothetical protein